MRRLRALPLFLALTAILGVGLTACAASEPLEVSSQTVIIDVRTPAEYADGHLDGAVNIDLNSGMFDENISALPTDGDYILYCRSGNRSAQAASIMGSAGFTNVVDAGSVGSASQATGIPIVSGG